MVADRTLRQALQHESGDNGTVPTEEFLHAFAQNSWILPDEQVKMMLRSLTATKDRVNIDEFLGSLRVDAFVPAKLDALCRDILAEMSTGLAAAVHEDVPVLLGRFFERVDKTKSGVVGAADLAEALRPLPSAADLSDQQLKAMAKYVGADEDDRINYPKLLGTMRVVYKGGRSTSNQTAGGQIDHPTPLSLLEDIIEAVCCIIVFEYGIGTIRRLLHLLSPPGSPRCSPEVFKRTLMLLSSGPSDMRLGTQQVDCIIDSLALGENEDFDFEDFLASFEILDTETGQTIKCV